MGPVQGVGLGLFLANCLANFSDTVNRYLCTILSDSVIATAGITSVSLTALS